MSCRCATCMFRADCRLGGLARPGCNHLMITGISRLREVYRRLGVDRITDEVREALRPENCVFYRRGERIELPERRMNIERPKPAAQRTPRREYACKLDRATAAQLYREGRTDGEIAAITEVSRSAVREWRHKQKLPPNVKPDERSEMIRALYEKGLTDRQISLKLGIGPSAPGKWRRARNLKKNVSPRSAALEERMKLYREGLTDAQIAAREGHLAESVAAWRRRHDLPANVQPTEEPACYAAARKAHGKGATDRELAAILGVTVHTAACWRRRQGLEVNKEPWRPRQKKEPAWRVQARRMLAEGLTDKEISAAVGLSRSAVSEWRVKEGLQINCAAEARRRKRGKA